MPRRAVPAPGPWPHRARMARPPGHPGPSQGGGPVDDDIVRGVAAVAVGRRLADAGGFRGRDAAGRALDRHKAEPGRRRRQRRLRARAGAYTAAAIDYKIADSRPGAPRPPEEPMFAKRSEGHTSELPSLMRHSYAVLCLKQKK